MFLRVLLQYLLVSNFHTNLNFSWGRRKAALLLLHVLVFERNLSSFKSSFFYYRIPYNSLKTIFSMAIASVLMNFLFRTLFFIPNIIENKEWRNIFIQIIFIWILFYFVYFSINCFIFSKILTRYSQTLFWVTLD